MSYSIKQLTSTSWILQKNSDRIAILSELPNKKIQVLGNLDQKLFDSMSDIEKFVGEQFKIEEVFENTDELDNINGFPIRHLSVNPVENTQGLPLYRKGNIIFAAGYYGIKFENGWSASYCPKQSTLTDNEYIGPFKNKLEMQNGISQKKRTSNI